MKFVDVIIVNWNAGPLLHRTLAALARSKQAAFRWGRIVVVDNASADDSLARLQAVSTPTLPLEVIRNETNRGFAAACNQGAAGSGADYLLFLNPDVEVEPDTLDTAVRVMDRSPDVGVLGVQLVDETGTPLRTCARFPTPTRYLWKALGLDAAAPRFFKPHYLTEFDHRSSRVVDQVMGAFFFVRRDVFQAQEGFDERFFVYFEEVDFALRARQAGWATLYCAEARAFHAGGGTTARIPARRLFYSLKSRLLYARKHFSTVGAAVVLFGTVLIEFPARLLYALWRSPGKGLFETASGFALLCRDMPSIFRRSPVARGR